MKLAEALALRADCQKRLEQLKTRLHRNAQVQEGDLPSEDPDELLAQVEEIAVELETLIRRINRTNIETPVDDTTTIADLLARRDVLSLRRGVYAELARDATIGYDRLGFGRSDFRFVGTVSVREMQKRADRLAKEYRELDTRLQATNWASELLE